MRFRARRDFIRGLSLLCGKIKEYEADERNIYQIVEEEIVRQRYNNEKGSISPI